MNTGSYDFGPTFASEKPAEDEEIPIGVSVLRRLLIGSGGWKGVRHTKECRSRRERRERFGERGLKSDGIPEALYCGKSNQRFANAFVLTREPTDAELLKGITDPKSHFGRACDKLGVGVIAAHSPQAKGRVERNHGVDQDRLVKELRLAGISTIAEANRFLEKTCLPKMNKKFSHTPADKADAHVPLGSVKLQDIFCFEYERVVGSDYAVRFEKRLFQILKTDKPLPRPKDKVIIRIFLDGNLAILWKENRTYGSQLLVKELANAQDHKNRDAA